MNGSSSGDKPQRIRPDEQFRGIQGITQDILNQALAATLSQQQFQAALFSLISPEFDRLLNEGNLEEALGSSEARQQLLRNSIERNIALQDQAQALSQQATTAAQNLGTLTADDERLISSAISNARAVGQQQIDSFVNDNFSLANEVAAARGLVPSDAPIGNIRGRVAEEAIKQKGTLESQLASQQASLSLDLPNQRAALLGQFAGQQLGLAQSGNQFQAALAQNATANRLNLAGTAGQLGLGLTGLASTGPGVLGASRPTVANRAVSSSGGISSERLKKNLQGVDSAEVLARLNTLPIAAWQYLWENGEEAFHIGPFAEDFEAAFGGEDYRIDFLHALGVSMVALQELSGRVESLERAVGLRH